MPSPFLYSYPRAILHVDGDSFFASCEIAKDPSLRGKPVVTGRERGIATSMNYEAKAFGITRAMTLREIKQRCPQVVIVESDYESYALYSKRMYDIVRRYTEEVEEYSIDECFADLTGMRRANKMSYPEMAERIYRELYNELGITFSVGLSINKVTAKMASKHRKPHGLTIVPGYNLHLYLAKTPVDKIWGIGPNTSAYLHKFGIVTAQDLASRDFSWVVANMSKPFQEMHQELNGAFINKLAVGAKHDYASISKTGTFTPPSTDRSFIYSQLSNNIENACIKLRAHKLFAKRFSFFLKTQEFRFKGLELKLDREVSVPEEILSVVAPRFDEVYRPGVLYRATGIILGELSHTRAETLDLFGQSPLTAKVEKVHEAIDELEERYGRHTVFLGSSWRALGKRSDTLRSSLGKNEKSAKKELVFVPPKPFSLPHLGKVG